MAPLRHSLGHSADGYFLLERADSAWCSPIKSTGILGNGEDF
jgi:hypothetical protein